MKKISIKTVSIFSLCLALQGNAEDYRYPVSQQQASQSIAWARVQCQQERFSSSQCMSLIQRADFVDEKIASLCFSRRYGKYDCIEASLDKFYHEDEVAACKTKKYSFLDCVREMGTLVSIVKDDDLDEDHSMIKQQLILVRTYLLAGRYNDAYRLIVNIERSLD